MRANFPPKAKALGLQSVKLDENSVKMTVKIGETDENTTPMTLTLPDPEAVVTAAAHAPLRHPIACADSKGRLYVWDMRSGDITHTLPLEGDWDDDRISRLIFSQDGKHLVSVTSSSNTMANLWDIDTGKEIPEFRVNPVYTVAFSPCGHKIACSMGNQIRLWDVRTGETLKILNGHTDDIDSVKYSPDDKTVVSDGYDGTIRFWDADTGELLRTIVRRTPSADVVFSPDGNTLAGTGGWINNTISLWDVETGEHTKTLTGHTARVLSVTYSADGGTLASGSWDGKIRFWDTDTGELLKTITAHTKGAHSIAYTPDGKSLVSGGWDNTINLWYVDTGHLLQTITGNITDANPSIGVRAIALNPDGRTLAVATDEALVRLWDMPTGKVKATLQTDRVAAVVFSPDGTMLASGGEGRSLCLWDAHTGKLLHNIVKARGSVYGVAFSPNGQIVASASWQTVELWNTVTGEHIGTFTGHPGWNKAVAFSPDGQTLASGNDYGNVILWDMNRIPVPDQ